MKEENPRDTPEESRTDENPPSGSKSTNNTVKDRKCDYCHQSFTSSSLGRHLDQFIYKKKPDGIHDVEAIRRVRSSITRRQARTTTGKRDSSPDGSQKRGQSESYGAGDSSSSKARDPPVRMMFNTPTWHATGVINDIPNPSRTLDAPRIPPSQPRAGSGSWQLPDYASRGATANNPDTMKALELALREVLDNIKAASSRFRPPASPFDFEIQQQTFPSLCLQLLPPPPSLFATHPFASPSSFPLQAPGIEHLEIVRQALRSKVSQWQSDQVAADPTQTRQLGTEHIFRTAQQHEEIGLRHLDLAFSHWNSLPLETRRDAWQLEITRAFSREAEKRKSVDEQLARVQQEANQLHAQVDKLASCQWPREFALFPPDKLPLSRDVARELDAKEGLMTPESSRWDYDNVVMKWKRVVMQNKSIGRIGVGYNPDTTPFAESDSSQLRQSPEIRPPRPGEDTSSHPNRLRPLQPAAMMSPDPAAASTPASSTTHYASPYQHNEPRSPPSASGSGPQAKRPRLMNGSDGPPAAPSDPAALGRPSGPWPSSTPFLSNIAAPSGQTPPPSSRN